MRELWKILKIMRWHKRKFPKLTYKEQLQRLSEKALECGDAVFFRDDDDMINLATDVIMASIEALRYKEVWALIEKRGDNDRVK